jgi:hypothetical protein
VQRCYRYITVHINSNKIEILFCLYFYLYKQHCTKTMLSVNISAFSTWTGVKPKTWEQTQEQWEEHILMELMAILQQPSLSIFIPSFL